MKFPDNKSNLVSDIHNALSEIAPSDSSDIIVYCSVSCPEWKKIGDSDDLFFVRLFCWSLQHVNGFEYKSPEFCIIAGELDPDQLHEELLKSLSDHGIILDSNIEWE